MVHPGVRGGSGGEGAELTLQDESERDGGDDTKGRTSAYGDTAQKAEQLLEKHVADSSKLTAVALRLATVYGSIHDHHTRLVPSIVTNALAHRPVQVAGDPLVDLVHINDVVDAFGLVVDRLERARHAKKKKTGMAVFSVHSNSSVTSKTIFGKVVTLTKSASPLQIIPRNDKYLDRYVSQPPASKLGGWRPKVPLDLGLRKLTKAYLEETATYLERKIQKECGERPGYSMADVLSLDGCSGSFAADINGEIRYANIREGQEKDGQWPELDMAWRDTDMPTDWTFEIKPKGDGASLKLRGKPRRSKADKVKGRDGSLGPKDQVVFQQANDAEFEITAVDPRTGFLTVKANGQPLLPTHVDDDWDWNDIQEVKVESSRFRITPYCCAGRNTAWPFYAYDPLASVILDERAHGHHKHKFDVSQPSVLCDRLAKAQKVTSERLEKLSDTDDSEIGVAPMPDRPSVQWSMRDKAICANLCDHPTVCLDTGDCACAQSNCVWPKRFPFAEYAGTGKTSYPPNLLDYSLAERAKVTPWLSVLRPHARRYFTNSPGWWEMNVTRVPPDVEDERLNKDPDKFDRVQTESHGCYSADSSMERAAKFISQPWRKNALVFLPHWEYTLRFPPVVEWVKNATKQHLPPEFDLKDMVVPFTFDWGRCNSILNHLFHIRTNGKASDELKSVSAWQPLGDLNSECYIMDQDVVIPTRTCLQDKLREAFPITKVKPAKDRSLLATFKGSPNGQGTIPRIKVQCDRPIPATAKLTNTDKLKTLWGALKDVEGDKEAKYMDTIGDSIFCPVPAGTVGWTYRLADVAYAGCIPVLVGDATHHYFWDVLDYTKFSVSVSWAELERLEQVLTDFTWDEIAQMQANLLVVRDAFLYPAEGHHKESLETRGPFFYAMHSAALLRQTTFPPAEGK